MCAHHDDAEEEKRELSGLYFISSLRQMPFSSTIFSSMPSRILCYIEDRFVLLENHFENWKYYGRREVKVTVNLRCNQ
jgi:hypothetical protein